MIPVLVIGYGNPLRRDDGAGPIVAERFAGQAGVRVIVVHQLVPELADEIAACCRIVFVDVAHGADRVAVRSLLPAVREMSSGHAGDPAWLLAISEALHHYHPVAWLVTLPAVDLGFGYGLSDTVQQAVEEAVALVKNLCADRPEPV